jgi:signal transduction histidine kinase
MKRLPRGGDLEWSVSAAPESVHVAIGQQDLEDMLGNLLDNACKWASNRVHIDAREDDADDQARGRDQAIVGSEHCGPQPADPLDKMRLTMKWAHGHDLRIRCCDRK